MKANNPMSRPENVEKIKAKLKGRTFLARGGNSKLTRQQLLIANSLELPTEVAIATRAVKADFVSLPPCYKVDIASVPHRLAIEIDGKSHRLKKWKFLDQRKTAVLTALGWTVIRFWNEEVENDFDRVTTEIKRHLQAMPLVDHSNAK
ncbi:endonuclease domain-containing protein [Massilia pinisoli]|uniref:Endonuclease domain-containing protein n=1 Tax=Massilia pinisoli TaxID=1772194 RepID=A0ABT1ZM79_9BURK|nr:endonuclease domain-containing protein [Massilia pinisoli]MCS0581012.1 endonuclease domain-containing protein [Massilia pinisoli]